MNTMEERLSLITRNLKDIIGIDELRNILSIENKTPVIYWGTAPTGKIHIGYFVQMLKIVDYVNAGCKVIILIADLHSMLDNMKSTSELITYRVDYYIESIKAMLRLFLTTEQIDLIEFIKGSSFQLSKEYTMDMYKLCSMLTLTNAKKASAEVVKHGENPTLGGLMYSILQALDEEYIGCDIQTGGYDQRKIMAYSRTILPMIGYKKRIELMTNMISGLRTTKNENLENVCDSKMSSSNINSKIEILDSKNTIKKKINKAYCLEKDVNDNCLLELLRDLIFPILEYSSTTKTFDIKRKEEYGGDKSFSNFQNVFDDFENGNLHPMDLKNGISQYLDSLLNPIREYFSDKLDFVKNAYP